MVSPSSMTTELFTPETLMITLRTFKNNLLLLLHSDNPNHAAIMGRKCAGSFFSEDSLRFLLFFSGAFSFTGKRM